MRAWWLAACLTAALATAPDCVAAQEAAQKAGAGLVVVGADGTEHVLTPAALDGLPVVTTVQDGAGRRFEGPLLWTVLDRTAAVDAPRFHDQVRQIVRLTGGDGYTATLALGEIAPEFENKQVIVAKRLDGQPLAPDHLRVVVPGDKRGGRGVHDLTRITVVVLPR